MAVIVILLSLLIAWESRLDKEEQETELLEASRAFFSQILVARRWNTMHGGVYVEATEDTQPNPYLDFPERDITSVSGKKYTMINPAYMTRQMSELAEDLGEFKYHITSLKYINPVNKPDEWEKKALTEFEKGTSENYTLTTLNNERLFRYMAPLHVGQTCLNCHHEQDYTIGDVRGGISIDLPVEMSDTVHAAKFRRTVLSYGAIGLATLLFISSVTWAFSRIIIRGIESEVEKNKLRASIELAGAAAHELRQPMTILMGFSGLIREKGPGAHITEEELDIIIDQCLRMDDIIIEMLNITRYRTKEYADGVQIFDLNGKKDTTSEDKEGGKTVS
jgi:hypothetical protein